MLAFLLKENVLTVATITGIFTVSMLTSFKNNVFDPLVENVLPTEELEHGISRFSIPLSSQPPSPPKCKVIKYKLFLRDFAVYLIYMLIVYMLWKRFVHPIKNNLSV
jgi:large-conductance mechanosensitive channel